jgi:RNA polymerase II subunit A C-terminal domain phosphatase
MVVIIDDRADVWEWSPNLVKVIPCQWLAVTHREISRTHIYFPDDFFVGIGDINSTFLPKATTSPPTLATGEVDLK